MFMFPLMFIGMDMEEGGMERDSWGFMLML